MHATYKMHCNRTYIRVKNNLLLLQLKINERRARSKHKLAKSVEIIDLMKYLSLYFIDKYLKVE